MASWDTTFTIMYAGFKLRTKVNRIRYATFSIGIMIINTQYLELFLSQILILTLAVYLFTYWDGTIKFNDYFKLDYFQDRTALLSFKRELTFFSGDLSHIKDKNSKK